MYTLNELGYTEALFKEADQIDNTLLKGRISAQHKGQYKVITETGIYDCELPGKYFFNETDFTQIPAVGDFCLIEPFPNEMKAMLKHRLTRTQAFIRNQAGNEVRPQIIAVNIQYALLAMSCNSNFNINRMERFLIAAYDSGAQPVIILTKSDLADELEKEVMRAELSGIAHDIPIYFVSQMNDDNIDTIKTLLQPNHTATIIGSSGIGKSSLINRLAGEEKMQTQDIRETDDKGKHTTTHREMILLKDGGIIIDTPGMRELQLWNDGTSTGLSSEFSDIEQLESLCKFNNCTHQNEPGCAIQEALNNGTLDRNRYERYLKYQKELDYQERRTDASLRRAEKDKWKKNNKLGAQLRQMKGNRR